MLYMFMFKIEYESKFNTNMKLQMKGVVSTNTVSVTPTPITTQNLTRPFSLVSSPHILLTTAPNGSHAKVNTVGY